MANTGLITNLPNGCTVELPCYVDGNGISPAWVGDLPMACAATCRVSVNVQEMAVEAALTGNRELVKLAVLHDPLTGAVCNPPEVWAMCDRCSRRWRRGCLSSTVRADVAGMRSQRWGLPRFPSAFLPPKTGITSV